MQQQKRGDIIGLLFLRIDLRNEAITADRQGRTG